MSSVTRSEAIDSDDPKKVLDAYRSRPKQLARWLLISRNQLKIDSLERLSRHSFSLSTISYAVG